MAEKCVKCETGVGAGLMLTYCKDTEPKKCDRLKAQYDSGDIGIDEVYIAVKKINKGNPKNLQMLEYVKDLANGSES